MPEPVSRFFLELLQLPTPCGEMKQKEEKEEKGEKVGKGRRRRSMHFHSQTPHLKTMLPGMTREETALAVRNGIASPSPFQTSLGDHTLPS